VNMMSKHIIVHLILSLFFVSLCSASMVDQICTRDEAIEAENEIDKLNDWDSLYKSFKQFAHCDDGAIAEGYSDIIGLLLGDWKNFNRVAELTASDLNFKRFVIKHLDETIPYDTGEKIFENVQKRCPSNAKKLCKLIECQLTLTRELAEPVSE
jgi:hypothetical protein